MTFSCCATAVSVVRQVRARKVHRASSSVLSARALSQSSESAPAPRPASMYVTEERGSENSPDYRLFFKDAQGPISPMHDIPLWADRARRLVHMVVEVPRWTTAKMEICLGEPLNPLRQDSKRGAPRHVANLFPHRGYLWNYGALPQTWEDPRRADAATGARGDNDPVDVLELGAARRPRGAVLRVRLLGALALLDEGETDWKLLAVAEGDPLFERLHCAADVEAACPGLLRATVEWFRLYKVPDGKPPNAFAFDGEVQPADVAYRVVDEVHESWRELVSGRAAADDISTMNVTVGESPARVERGAAAAALARAPPRGVPQPRPPEADHWHFLASI